ncbi:MAG: non-hydrolyzing UDP-N-acetylglucosamine 2-epimerase [Halorhabdus sp.]
MTEQYLQEMGTRLALVLGTRPEIIKLSPILRACETRDVQHTIIHTGQHYSEELDRLFFDQLNLDRPDYNLQVGSKSQGRQTGEMIADIEAVLLEEEFDMALVQGDTNSVLAGAIATSKLDIGLGHVEAGLRSGDRAMPEEINRILTDHAADYLFAPTDRAATTLRGEGIPDGRISVTGNTIVDAVRQHERLADEKSTVLTDLGLGPEEYVLLTLHRAGNVDEPKRFRDILRGVSQFAAGRDHPVVYPVHPRAKRRMGEFDLAVPDPVRIVPPQDFLDFLALENRAEVVFTDSGGVQEETCILGTPCVTVRDSTERPETLDVGSNELVGTDPEAIVTGGETMVEKPTDWENPFGDGRAAEQILDVVVDART